MDHTYKYTDTEHNINNNLNTLSFCSTLKKQNPSILTNHVQQKNNFSEQKKNIKKWGKKYFPQPNPIFFFLPKMSKTQLNTKKIRD